MEGNKTLEKLKDLKKKFNPKVKTASAMYFSDLIAIHRYDFRCLSEHKPSPTFV